MRIIYTLIGLIFFVNNLAFSQDVLLFQDGNKKDAKILEITPEFVKYQKFNSYSEVVYTEDKYNLIGVIFEDGEFEKFETKKNRPSNIVNSSRVSDYGHNMFSFNPLALINGLIIMNYEHFSNNGKSAIRVPLWIDITDGNDFDPSDLDLNSIVSGAILNGDFLEYRTNLLMGIEQRFFPTGHDGLARGFIGYAQHFGFISYVQKYYYEEYYNGWYNTYYYDQIDTRFAEKTQFIGGIQLHPSRLIAITLDAGIGVGYVFGGVDEVYFAYNLGLSFGFRF